MVPIWRAPQSFPMPSATCSLQDLSAARSSRTTAGSPTRCKCTGPILRSPGIPTGAEFRSGPSGIPRSGAISSSQTLARSRGKVCAAAYRKYWPRFSESISYRAPPRLPIKSLYVNLLESFLRFRARFNLRLAQKVANLAHLCFLNRLTRRF
jgi:hypothetical protein